jgi:hypothetical protein
MTRLIFINRFFHPDHSATSRFAASVRRYYWQGG